MLVHALEHRDFRNLKNERFEPAAGVNVIYGDNAQGKTNLLEAIWLFTGGRSFRGARDSDMIAFGCEKAVLSLEFTSGNRRQDASISVTGRRSVTIGGIPKPSPSALAGVFGTVVFSPAHLLLIQDGPEARRRFIDGAYCQLRPGYLRILSTYQRTLAQRNSLLRRARENPRERSQLGMQLDVWDERLSVAGANVFAARSAYTKRLAEPAARIYAGIAGSCAGEADQEDDRAPPKKDGEALNIAYNAFAPAHEPAIQAAQLLREKLAESRERDLAAGHTAEGPHRDDLEVSIGGRNARVYGSQGQQRSAVLALKMAEASLLQEVTEEPPVALLDDVMSELDTGRQDYILNHIGGWQVFLTCCDPAAVLRMTGGRAYRMENGGLTPD